MNLIAGLIFMLPALLVPTESTIYPKLKDKLTIFLADSMQNFPLWISENGFDPSPLLEDMVVLRENNSEIDVTCTLRNQYIKGFSQAFGYSSGGSYIEENFIWVSLSTNVELTFGGEHVTSGFLKRFDSDVWFGGRGTFEMKLSLPAQTLLSEYISLTPDGKYLDFGDHPGYTSSPILRGHRTIFNGIVSEGSMIKQTDDEITDWFEIIYHSYLRHDRHPINPAKSLFHRYITHLFQTTPISEILTYSPIHIKTEEYTCNDSSITLGMLILIVALSILFCSACIIGIYIAVRQCKNPGYRHLIV